MLHKRVLLIQWRFNTNLTGIAYGLEPPIRIKIYIPGVNQLSVAKQID